MRRLAKKAGGTIVIAAILAMATLTNAQRERLEETAGQASVAPRQRFCAAPPWEHTLLPPLALPIADFTTINQELANRNDRQAWALQFTFERLHLCVYRGYTIEVPWELADAIRTYVLSRELQATDPQVWEAALNALDEADLCISINVPGQQAQ